MYYLPRARYCGIEIGNLELYPTSADGKSETAFDEREERDHTDRRPSFVPDPSRFRERRPGSERVDLRGGQARRRNPGPRAPGKSSSREV